MEKKYPIGGYAPGNYQCHCTTCGGGFIGDKRACQCEPCAVAERKKFDALTPDEQEIVLKGNAELAKEMFSKRQIKSGHQPPAEAEALTIDDYEAVLADHRRLVRELDVIINGANAAKQASLVDMVCQIRDLWPRQGIGWVKASERLPENPGVYCIKWHGKFYTADYYPVSKRFYISSYGAIATTTVEWLDESAGEKEVNHG